MTNFSNNEQQQTQQTQQSRERPALPVVAMPPITGAHFMKRVSLFLPVHNHTDDLQDADITKRKRLSDVCWRVFLFILSVIQFRTMC